MDVPARALGEPLADYLRLVCRVVVDDHVDIEVEGGRCLPYS